MLSAPTTQKSFLMHRGGGAAKGNVWGSGVVLWPRCGLMGVGSKLGGLCVFHMHSFLYVGLTSIKRSF